MVRGIIKKVLLFAATGSISIVIAACYGVMVPLGMFRTWCIRVRDQQGTPIRGLHVSMRSSSGSSREVLSASATDSNGIAFVNVERDSSDGPIVAREYSAVIEDQDSTENGGWFGTTEQTLTDADTIDIVVQPRAVQ